MISPKDTSLIEEELGAFSFMLFNAAFSSKSFRMILLHCYVLLTCAAWVHLVTSHVAWCNKKLWPLLHTKCTSVFQIRMPHKNILKEVISYSGEIIKGFKKIYLGFWLVHSSTLNLKSDNFLQFLSKLVKQRILWHFTLIFSYMTHKCFYEEIMRNKMIDCL